MNVFVRVVACRLVGIAAGCLVLVATAAAQLPRGQMPARASGPENERGRPQFPKTYGPLDAGRDAYERAERQRRQVIDRQLQTIEDMVWYSGLPGFDRVPASLDAVYAGVAAHVPRRALRRAYRAGYPHATYRYSYPQYAYPKTPFVFEPWPLVPGDIYGYPYVDRVEQPHVTGVGVA